MDLVRLIFNRNFISLAQSLGINVTEDNIEEIVGQPPLSSVLEPMTPEAQEIIFKGEWIGEDLLFCRRIKSLGFPIYVNTGAILPHSKSYWLKEEHHDSWRD